MNGKERKDFVRNHRTAIFGYGRKEHGPSMSCCYYVMDGNDILVSTMAGRAKAKAVQRNPKVSLCILDENWPPTYLLVYGEATIEPELGADMLIKICELMAEGPMDDDAKAHLVELAAEEERVAIRFKPYATFESPPRHTYSSSDAMTLTHDYGANLPWDAD